MPRSLFITGASSGIGAALAVHYAQPRVRMVLQGRDTGRLNRVVDQCRQAGADVQSLICDVRNHDVLATELLQCDDDHPLDCVIANAGISGGPRADGFETSAQVRDIFDVNVIGVGNTIMPLVPRMISRGHGHLVMVSSLAGFAPWPGAPAYAASKAAVTTFGLALRSSLVGTGVSVHVVCPGFIDTPMTRVNPYSMPWLMTAEAAAQKVAAGLARDRAVIAFPFRANLATRMIGMLPFWVQQKLLRGFPAKPPRPE